MSVIRRIKLALTGGSGPRVSYDDDKSSLTTMSSYMRSGNYQKIYESISSIREPIDMTAELVVRPDIKFEWSDPEYENDEVIEKVRLRFEEINLRAYLAYSTRHLIVEGCSAFEVVRDDDALPTILAPLHSSQLVNEVEDYTLSGFTYKPAKGQEIDYDRDDVFYVVRNPFVDMWTGESAVKQLDTLLEDLDDARENLREVGRKLWKKSWLFEVDDAELDDDESDDLFTKLLGMEPGKSLAINQEVKATPIQTSGDLSSLMMNRTQILAEISDNFGLPRVLGATSKSADMGTLRPALALFYDFKVRPLQIIQQVEITERLVEPFIRSEIGDEDIHLKVSFMKISIGDFSTLATALSTLVEKEIASEDEARGLLGF